MAGWTAIAKTRKTNRVRPNMRAQKLFTGRSPEYGLQVSNRRWLQSVIHITFHRIAICALAARPFAKEMFTNLARSLASLSPCASRALPTTNNGVPHPRGAFVFAARVGQHDP